MSATATEARRRHPCMRPPVSRAAIRARVLDELDLHGAPHPDVASAIIAVRGAAGVDQAGFAHRAGVDVGLLRRAEAGELGRDQLPGALRRMVPPAG